MNVAQFQQKWRNANLKERSAAQEHFLDLCRVLGVPTPAEADPDGSFFTFEAGVGKAGGGAGFADVFYRGHFAWEYKGKHADLEAAYKQVLLYKDALQNPPLLVTCDLIRFVIKTNFTGTVTETYEFTIDDLSDPIYLQILTNAFTDPEKLRPDIPISYPTEQAARRFGALAIALNARGHDPAVVAHFLVQVLFCLVAEDMGLLERGMFTDLLAFGAKRPERFPAQAAALFEAMRDGGDFNLKEVARFNGGLFATIDPLPFTVEELRLLAQDATADWSQLEPTIFGTLFERSLDPSKRSQLGAHYTGREDIDRVVEPVILAPLRREWETVREEAVRIAAERDAARDAGNTRLRDARQRDLQGCLGAFQDRLASVTVLDPACGSGNFLSVALAGLKGLEKEVAVTGSALGLAIAYLRVSPRQMLGMEINAYARELAQATVWLTHLKWMLDNGFGTQARVDPILEPLETIRLQDALLDRSDPDHPRPAAWPAAEFIVGNPPFLGGKRLRSELGDAYVDDLFTAYDKTVAREADLCCYFFEKARQQIANKLTKRAGLLATNSIRGGANRDVVKRIKDSGDVFMAWSDQPWVLDGAAVRISIVGFDDGSDPERCLDNVPVAAINSDLTSSVDITGAARLTENLGIAFMGDTKGGAFDISGDLARQMLARLGNPNGRPNSDVVRPWVNGLDITRRPRDMWIIDFGVDMSEQDAACYEAPFAYVEQHVKPERAANNRDAYRKKWWLHVEARSGWREAVSTCEQFACTARVAKHRLFSLLQAETLPDSATIAFAREDDYFFGVLHSRAHEVWSLRMGTSLEDRPRYTPTTCFETFPLPWPPGREPQPGEPGHDRVAAIAAAAADLDRKRRNWLDPEGSTEEQRKRLTLTNLYNDRPAWLRHCHLALDRAVWAAYGWEDATDPDATPDEAILARLLALNGERAGLRGGRRPSPVIATREGARDVAGSDEIPRSSG